MGGITRIHGSLVAPKNFAGVALRDYTLTFWNGDVYKLSADLALPAGALDQVFKTVVSNASSVSRVGTLTTGTGASANYIRFAIETLGVDAGEYSHVGAGGLYGNNPTLVDASTASTVLQAAIRAIGDVTNSAGATIYLTSATVAAFTY